MEEGELLVSLESKLRVSSFLFSVFARPKEFVKKASYPEDSDEENSTVGKMPPQESDSED